MRAWLQQKEHNLLSRIWSTLTVAHVITDVRFIVWSSSSSLEAINVREIMADYGIRQANNTEGTAQSETVLDDRSLKSLWNAS